MLKSLFTIILLLFLIAVNAQTVLKGTATDENNTPVKDANVLLEDTLKEVSANDNGTYNVSSLIPKTYFARVSYSGCNAQTIKITDKTGDTPSDVLLLKTSHQFIEVVIPGYHSRLENLQLTAASVSMVNTKEIAWLKRNERNEWNCIPPNFRSFDVVSKEGSPYSNCSLLYQSNCLLLTSLLTHV
ncbi:MAG: carboxypeptidase regulatory-like domain-containing protein [Bacteroidota bacterium]